MKRGDRGTGEVPTSLISEGESGSKGCRAMAVISKIWEGHSNRKIVNQNRAQSTPIELRMKAEDDDDDDER